MSSINMVHLVIGDHHVVMDNGILKVTLSKPGGIVTGIRYNGIDNLLEVINEEDNRGIKGTNFKVIVEEEERVEISFTRKWNTSLIDQRVPLNIDIRYVMLGNSSGFYAYAIYEHLKEWPPFNLPQTRIYMAVGDNRQRHMPLPDDRVPPRGKELAFPEAVLLVNPVEPEFKGEVDDKYEYSCENRDLKVHGWICKKPGIGFWQITPSNEFRSGGPLKQNLTSHVGPITLAMFLSAHYAGEDMVLKFQSNEPWKKVFGPVFIYLNSLPNGTDTLHLWDDAKIQMMIEVQNWPYNFIASEDFPSSDQRGCLSGRLKVRDRYISEEDIVCGEEAHIGLAPPGCDIDMGEIVYEPPRDGPTLWEIGIPNRSAAEFYVPDPNPNYVNPLYLNHPDRFRQYGLWERYAELYPDGDLIYTIGVNDYTKDWFFAHVTRKTENDTYEETTWQIKFDLDNKIETANATFQLRIALATANAAQLEVRINDENGNAPLFNSGQIGHDNAIARHGIHGVYRLFNISIPGSLLVNGKTNTIFLTQANNTSPLQGFMYDYIRLEAPQIASHHIT
ncbi:hypothetical protein G4B88_002810 [Cannabis sativa]|uniref:Rhamnogalacturonan lyase domain-containing protein n=1 Tax=Cannabis sativa TaxID=3483 RepID=A0A7J6HI31_CANSA|nr:hypothetical protein G4B88_002810 [Cannabis sativa]